MAYTAQISRAQKALCVLLVDQSSSMEDPCAGAGGVSKSKFLADVTNRVLFEMVNRSKKENQINDYFDIAMLGYSGRNRGEPKVENMFGGDLKGREIVSLEEVAFQPIRIEDRLRKEPDGAGGIVELKVKFPVWLEAIADGYTPMCAALRATRELVRRWIDDANHRESFPPIVLNITDGESTDGDPQAEAAALRSLVTEDGNVLILNCHISSTQAHPVSFPSSEAELPSDAFARALFSMSAVLPDSMIQGAASSGYELHEGARGFVFNGDAEQVVKFLDIGTRVGEMR